MENTPFGPGFVGRSTELTAIAQALSDAEGGRPQAVIVGGEAGVGKTRLVEEFIVRARADGAVAAVGVCVEAGADALPFAPFSMVLRSLRRQYPEELAAAARGQEDELARILPELGRPTERAYGEDGTARLFELTARLLERMATERTVVLVVEDLHWADTSTRHLLEYLVRVPSGGRLLAIGTYRSDGLHRRHPLRSLLGELDRMRWSTASNCLVSTVPRWSGSWPASSPHHPSPHWPRRSSPAPTATRSSSRSLRPRSDQVPG